MKLIIVGNGFDLHSGLKSKFSDFFNKTMVNEEGCYDATKIRTNIWYLLFYFRFIDGVDDGVCKLLKNNDPLWMDVEDFISFVLKNKNGAMIGHPFLTIDNLLKSNNRTIIHPIDSNIVLSKSFQEQQAEISSLVFSKARSKNACDFLLSELNAFEDDFSQYLLKQIKGNLYYKTNTTILLNDLLKQDSAFFINFNYTTIPNGGVSLSVHGTLADGNIIIGTDVSTLSGENDKRVLRFTKAWRKMSNGGGSIKIPEKIRITEIVFFGHSLSYQDYSYFHAVFNYYDIYDSNVVLTFLYSNHEFKDAAKTIPDDEKNEKNRLDYVDKIFSLLRDYVKKTKSDIEADSVITKIQLENRLRIVNIEDY